MTKNKSTQTFNFKSKEISKNCLNNIGYYSTEAQIYDNDIGPESFMTYIMPISLIIFFSIRFKYSEKLIKYVMIFAIWQWLLSIKNILIGPIYVDSGIIQWALLILAIYFKSKFATLGMCLAVSISNIIIVFHILSKKPWNNNYLKTAKYFKKSTFWAKIFTVYLMGSGVLWLWITYDIYKFPKDKIFL